MGIAQRRIGQVVAGAILQLLGIGLLGIGTQLAVVGLYLAQDGLNSLSLPLSPYSEAGKQAEGQGYE